MSDSDGEGGGAGGDGGMTPHMYSSITNKQGDIAHVAEAFDHLTEWVATPKVHGTNVSFFMKPGEEVVCCRRKGVLGPDEHFHGIRDMAAGMSSGFESLAGKFVDQSVQLYGELYGGLYRHKDVPDSDRVAAIQKEIQYGPDRYFIGFDVRVNGTWLDFEDAKAICEECGIPFVPIVARGTRLEMQDWATEHRNDPVKEPILAPGMPPIEGNIGEGHVIRPTKLVAGKRLCLKIKADHTSEVATKAKKPRKKESKEPEDDVTAAWRLHLVPHRITNVVTKATDEERTMKNVRLLAARVLDDVEKDAEIASTDEQKAESRKKLMGTACKLVSAHLRSMMS